MRFLPYFCKRGNCKYTTKCFGYGKKMLGMKVGINFALENDVNILTWVVE